MGHRHGSGDIRSGCVRWGGADSPRSRADPRQYSQGTHTVQTQALGRGFLLPVTRSTSQLAKEARHRTHSRSPTRMAGRSDLRPIQCVKAIFSTDGSSDRSPAISATPSQTTSPSPPNGHIKTQNNAWRINPDKGILLALATGMTGMGGCWHPTATGATALRFAQVRSGSHHCNPTNRGCAHPNRAWPPSASK